MNANDITKEELLALGVDKDVAALEALVDKLNDEVSELVGEEIIDSLTPDDVVLLADMQSDKTEQEIAEWITTHVPDYPEILQNNKDIVLGEFADSLADK